ncbi:MAG: polyprenyl synthetase family protein, partial [Planctomycetes bacterium]|nr:polyprenyl synthetase family protein [Planctomycetota bacterium]
RAEELGYKVLVAEGSPIVLKIIVSGHIDGILGVACLNVLEKAIDKVLIAGVPSYAIPLHSGDCKNTTLDEPWVWDVLDKYEPLPAPQTKSYVPLMRSANRLFDAEFERLLPRVRTQGERRASAPRSVQSLEAAASQSSRNGNGTGGGTDREADASRSPLALTEHLAYDWLANGGKRFRPFMTLAAFDAVTGGKATSAGRDGDEAIAVSDGTGRVSMAIEAFHKASLIHDDIEDDDLYRYGRETLHRRYDLGTAINVGDYLIGLGYRLVNSARGEIGAEAAGDIVERMAAAHVKLCDGQGAEMAWQKSPDLALTPLDALQIYALKTSPAFEAALYAGLRMAGPTTAYDEMLPVFARHLGVGFQVLNDLKDWHGDGNNKLIAGQDALALRPTVLLAFALEAANGRQRQELEAIYANGTDAAPLRLGRLRRLFEELRVFEKAESLVDKSRVRAEALADDVEPDELRELLYFLVDTVLAPEEHEGDAAHPADSKVLVPLPIAAAR